MRKDKNGTLYVDIVRESAYLHALRIIVIGVLEGLTCEAFLFGSRVNGRIRRSSDFDIGISGLSEAAFNSVKRDIVDQVEESSIPHGIDVVNFDSTNESFKREALREVEIWKSA